MLSERCYGLTGHEGAYNLYENELRLGHIISTLDSISSDIKEIKQNQRMLEKKTDRYMDMVGNLEKYLSDRSFNEALVQELVEYVEIYKNGSIHVCFKCDDKFKQITELIEGVKSA